MHFDNLQPGLSAPLPRADDDDDDDEEETTPPAEKKSEAPVGLVIQKKFLKQRKIFLWGAVTDATTFRVTAQYSAYRYPPPIMALEAAHGDKVVIVAKGADAKDAVTSSYYVTVMNDYDENGNLIEYSVGYYNTEIMHYHVDYI